MLVTKLTYSHIITLLYISSTNPRQLAQITSVVSEPY